MKEKRTKEKKFCPDIRDCEFRELKDSGTKDPNGINWKVYVCVRCGRKRVDR